MTLVNFVLSVFFLDILAKFQRFLSRLTLTKIETKLIIIRHVAMLEANLIIKCVLHS